MAYIYIYIQVCNTHSFLSNQPTKGRATQQNKINIPVVAAAPRRPCYRNSCSIHSLFVIVEEEINIPGAQDANRCVSSPCFAVTNCRQLLPCLPSFLQRQLSCQMIAWRTSMLFRFRASPRARAARGTSAEGAWDKVPKTYGTFDSVL
jgi:hypothetical protein